MTTVYEAVISAVMTAGVALGLGLLFWLARDLFTARDTR